MATMVTPPAGDERRATAGRWVLRGVGVLAVWTVWTVLVGAPLLVTGETGTAASTAIAIAAMLVALLPTWFLVRRAPGRRWIMAGATVVLVVVGFVLGGLGGPSLARMTSVGASLPVATGGQLLTVSSVENTLCLQECSQVTYLYAVLDSATASDQVGTELVVRGWESLGAGTYCRDDFGVRLTDVADPIIADPPTPPPGMEVLSVSTSRCERA
ncbi:hypothetical protein [Cellulomonas xylanilytica]|uniref:Uncharacterized protein n=1 Tax=Cellulomonas xylanilytica TaxID=233583 RepID=A0A510V0G7_9CELL|nr:hypothetical protein [Cellulomonas xylanilytica]GEK20402.1 hypothetical protein CXY01_09220 [Cellulomonas xylanilytica]